MWSYIHMGQLLDPAPDVQDPNLITEFHWTNLAYSTPDFCLCLFCDYFCYWVITTAFKLPCLHICPWIVDI